MYHVQAKGQGWFSVEYFDDVFSAISFCHVVPYQEVRVIEVFANGDKLRVYLRPPVKLAKINWVKEGF